MPDMTLPKEAQAAVERAKRVSGRNPESVMLAEDIAMLAAGWAQALAQVQKLCLICGRTEPCELDKRETSPDPDNWPGSPCTFDPSPQELYDALAQAKRELAKDRAKLAALIEAGVTDYSKLTDTNRVDCHFCNGVWRTEEPAKHKSTCPLAAILGGSE